MTKEWLKELQTSRSVIWLCRHNQQEKRKVKGSGLTIKLEDVTTIRLVEINKKEAGRIRESHHTKATKDVVLQAEEEVVVENLTKVTFSVSNVRSMVTTLVISLKNKRIKIMMQSLQSMKKKRCC
jgi:hypothetical protein